METGERSQKRQRRRGVKEERVSPQLALCSLSDLSLNVGAPKLLCEANHAGQVLSGHGSTQGLYYQIENTDGNREQEREGV